MSARAERTDAYRDTAALGTLFDFAPAPENRLYGISVPRDTLRPVFDMLAEMGGLTGIRSKRILTPSEVGVLRFDQAPRPVLVLQPADRAVLNPYMYQSLKPWDRREALAIHYGTGKNHSRVFLEFDGNAHPHLIFQHKNKNGMIVLPVVAETGASGRPVYHMNPYLEENPPTAIILVLNNLRFANPDFAGQSVVDVLQPSS